MKGFDLNKLVFFDISNTYLDVLMTAQDKRWTHKTLLTTSKKIKTTSTSKRTWRFFINNLSYPT